MVAAGFDGGGRSGWLLTMKLCQSIHPALQLGQCHVPDVIGADAVLSEGEGDAAESGES